MLSFKNFVILFDTLNEINELNETPVLTIRLFLWKIRKDKSVQRFHASILSFKIMVYYLSLLCNELQSKGILFTNFLIPMTFSEQQAVNLVKDYSSTLI